MASNNTYFIKGDKIKVDGSIYTVDGSIMFLNDADNYKWIEYKIKDIKDGSIAWLSIDSTYSEFAIYRTCRKSKDFTEDGLQQKGYRETDYGHASVIESSGNVDTEIGDRVRYSEYEDVSEENIMAIEDWEDETEYSKGYYLDENEIEKLSNQDTNNTVSQENSDEKYSETMTSDESNYSNHSSSTSGIIIIICVIVVAIIGVFASFTGSSGSTKIEDFIKSSTDFTYYTSMTSDLDDKQKADVYQTKLSVEAASKLIIDGIEGDTESVQDNSEDGSVAILTKDEYCLVYTSEDSQTLVQISTRNYAYSSTHRPYHARHSTGLFYRSYYYNRCYNTDSSRYSRSNNGYENYTNTSTNTGYNDNNKYKTYSDSVRDSSVGSRPSSGGGTSSGK